MWAAFVQWFSNLIQFIYELTVNMGFPSYAISIIVIAVLIKVVLIPLTHKQLKSMRAMQEIQPDVKYLQEKYKEDPETLQKKTMELYKEKGVNPFGGCLPLLIQMPIFIAFYQSLVKFQFTVAEHAGFFWIPNLADKDPYYIMGILMAASTYLQQKISTVNAKDPTQKSMLIMMPLMMAWLGATMPAGLPLYWITFNILGILQQLYVNWSLKKEKLNTGVGVKRDSSEIEEQDRDNDDKNSDSESDAGREKGGKSINEKQNSRKKRKKRR